MDDITYLIARVHGTYQLLGSAARSLLGKGGRGVRMPEIQLNYSSEAAAFPGFNSSRLSLSAMNCKQAMNWLGDHG